MPQWRKLHVKATESLDINDMPDDFTRLLWLMLPLGLCREGRGLDNPAWIKSKIMPLRLDVSIKMIESSMNWFHKRGMIERYEIDKRRYFFLPTWADYQGNTSREAESLYPEPGDNSRVTHEQIASRSSTDSDSDSDSDARVITDKIELEFFAVLELWKELFPEKSQPRRSKSTSHYKKFRTRYKNSDFRERWREALERASQCRELHKKSWFNFGFFVRNDENYEKMIDGWMMWKDQESATNDTDQILRDYSDRVKKRNMNK